MWHFLVTRVCSALVVIVGVVCIVFFLIHVLPGDPVEVMLGETAQPAERTALRAALGLDQPLWQQWRHYVSGLLQGDLGISLHSQRPVADMLLERIPATALLAITGLSVAIAIALPLGILAATRKDTAWDHCATVFAMLGVSIPNFWMGPVLILIFSVWLGWFPVSGDHGMASIVLPALTLGTALAALLTRMVRYALLDSLDQDYIRTAQAKGLARSRIIWRHALSNASLPLITVLGLQLGALLGGAVITETIFAWPGIGQLTIESIQRRDYPVIQACVLVISLSYVAINTVTDLLYGWLDPRVRLDQD